MTENEKSAERECDAHRQAAEKAEKQFAEERNRLHSIIEGTQVDLQSVEHDKTSVYWRLISALAKYAEDFP